jgi:poly(3-hydroxybutyrate) depolymerase
MAVAVILLLVAGAWLMAACGSSRGTKTDASLLRPTTALPATLSGVADDADDRSDRGFVTRLASMPAGYGSAGREFIVHAPAKAGPNRPLVILLHGLYQTPEVVERATAAVRFSDAHGFTLVYPFGENRAWNAGTCCRGDTANDVGFMVDLVHYVSTLTPVDRHRVYIWGFSNGGMMAWRTVCETKHVFAGAGVVAGALLVPCPTPVHVVDLHGTADRTVPFLGGFSAYTHTVFPDSVDESSRLVKGSTLQRLLIKNLGHRWPTPKHGAVDALDVLWNGLHDYRVPHPAKSAVSAAV